MPEYATLGTICAPLGTTCVPLGTESGALLDAAVMNCLGLGGAESQAVVQAPARAVGVGRVQA